MKVWKAKFWPALVGYSIDRWFLRYEIGELFSQTQMLFQQPPIKIGEDEMSVETDSCVIGVIAVSEDVVIEGKLTEYMTSFSEVGDAQTSA